jgi:uncharacterized protein
VTTEEKVNQRDWWWGDVDGRAASDPGDGTLVSVDDLDALVSQWLTLPDVAEHLGLDVGKVRRLLQEGYLVGVRRGERNVLTVPAAFLADGAPLSELRGTLTVLRDSGYDDEAAIRWLFTPDDTLPGTPIDGLRAGRKTEVRRRAQALAF